MKKQPQIALAQISTIPRNINDNILKMKAIANECRKNFPDVRLLLFPELCTTGYFLSEELKSVAQTRNGSIFAEISRLAQTVQMYIAYGYVETDDTGNLYNSLMLIAPNGKYLDNYRKIHLTPLEKNWFTPGSGLVVVDIDLGRIGLMICWDLAFPELARLLAVRGANLLLAPCAWEFPFDEPFQKFCMARVLDNTVYVAACNQVGSTSSFHFFGRSSVHEPDGNIIEMATNHEQQIIVTTIDERRQHQLKQTFYTMMSERRIDLYKMEYEHKKIVDLSILLAYPSFSILAPYPCRRANYR